ncbi:MULTISPECIES: hypothetical protein [unclassified Streptomyces]|uniref:hypothetical protein n=1 Tax=unclassified Streptomyces TaxID=2593676 RepID=UPI0003660EFD|nr:MULTISPECIES: hypothetical protein [unclassified Streptomyces]EYT78464.1 membrane protein [Streptomyces sp. Tu 6176]
MTTAEEKQTGEKQTGPARTRLISGPGILLVWLYGVMVVGAVSRSAYQIATDFGRAPLAYTLSAVAGLVYGFITYSLVRGGEKARTAALVCCAAELVGVLTVGTWTLAEPSAFPDATVWSDYGAGYLFIPVLLPLSALYWLRKARRQEQTAAASTA